MRMLFIVIAVVKNCSRDITERSYILSVLLSKEVNRNSIVNERGFKLYIVTIRRLHRQGIVLAKADDFYFSCFLHSEANQESNVPVKKN